jgi:hypothetical protein
MNTAAAEEVLEALAELRTLIAECKVMREELRAIINICVAHADVATLEAILTHLERIG